MIDGGNFSNSRPTQSTSPDLLHLQAEFEEKRDGLLDTVKADHLQQPLAFWALSSDRGLPYAFLERNVGDLLETPFDRLAATPGIGLRKLKTLVKLLGRVASPQEDLANPSDPPTPTQQKSVSEFGPESVNEAEWSRWVDAVKVANLVHETLGHVTPSLQLLPENLWCKKLGEYCEFTIVELTRMQAHKREHILAIMRIFRQVNRLVKNCEKSGLSFRLMPKFIAQAQRGLMESNSGEGPLLAEQINERIVRPITEQIRIDLGETHFELINCRLGVNTNAMSHTSLARKFSMSRSEVNHHLTRCARAFNVRWQDGFVRLCQIQDRVQNDSNAMKLMCELRHLLFPNGDVK